jgi:phosphatidylcholine synthase
MQEYRSNAEALQPPTAQDRALAWIAHLFTASGAIWGLLTLLAITNGKWLAAFGWIGVVIVVDSFDGYLARRVRVKDVLPDFDGALLDNMLDYLNYVFIPAYFLTQHNFLPESVAALGASLILLASAYQFSQGDAKTEDHYFKGFPSYWNVLVFYLFILNLDPWVNFTIIAIFAVLVFVPVKYIYPSRTTFFPKINLSAIAVWAITLLVMWFMYPNYPTWVVWLSLLLALFYTMMSLAATFLTRR